jgi:lipopolysaccharide transport system permease protein
VTYVADARPHGVDVVRALAVSDARVRYGRGRLRAVKWLLDPYAAAGVYLLLVAFVLDRAGTAPGLSVACAIVPFQLVVMTVLNTMTAVQTRRSIITNMRFDRGLIPVAATVTETIGFAAALTLIPLMMAVYGVAPTAAVLWLPVLVAATFLLALAAAYPTALIGLWFPDARPLVVSLARAAFFVAPGIVALDQVDGAARDWLHVNPLTGLFESYRAVFLEGAAPTAWHLLVPVATAILVLAIAVPLFRRESAQMAKIMEME